MGWSFPLFSIMQKTRAVSLTENRPGLRREEIFNAWIHFAKYGNPNHDLPAQMGSVYQRHRALYGFGAPSACRVNHDEELLSIINELKGDK